MLDPRYAYMSAYLKGEEPKLVSTDHVEKLSRATSVEDGLGTIRGTELGDYLEGFPIHTFEELEHTLWRYLSERIDHLMSFRFLPRDMASLCHVFTVRYDVSNMKAAVQRIATGERSPLIPVGIIHGNGLLDELGDAETAVDIADILTRARLAGYVAIVRESDIGSAPRQKLEFEARMDGEYYKTMLDTARTVRDGAVLFKAIGLNIDLANLEIVCRATAQDLGTDAGDALIPGGYILSEKSLRDLLAAKLADLPRRVEEEQYNGVVDEVVKIFDRNKSLASIAETIEKHRFAMLRAMLAPRSLSPLVMAWYLILKENEIRNVRLVFKALSDGIPVSEVRDYLIF